MKKCSYKDLNDNEKKLMEFDSTYLNTKAIFKDSAASLTMNSSHAYLKKEEIKKIAFLKNVKKIIKLLCLSFITVIAVFFVVHKANFKFLL